MTPIEFETIMMPSLLNTVYGLSSCDLTIKLDEQGVSVRCTSIQSTDNPDAVYFVAQYRNFSDAHRADGPAVFIYNITEHNNYLTRKEFWLNGKLSCMTGPAIEEFDTSGNTTNAEYYLKGNKFEDEVDWQIECMQIKASNALHGMSAPVQGV